MHQKIQETHETQETYMSNWHATSSSKEKSSCSRTIVRKFVAHRAMYMHVNMICSSTALHKEIRGKRKSEHSTIKCELQQMG